MADNNDALDAVQNAAAGYEGIAVEDDLGETTIVTDEPTEESEDPNDGEEPEDQDENSEESAEEETEESSGTDPDVQLALELYRAINSPNGSQVLKALAKAKGIELAEDYEVVDDDEEFDFTGFVKERLNPKLQFLAEDFGKILKDFDKIQNQKVSSVKQETAKSAYTATLQAELEKFGQTVGIDINDSKNKISDKMVEIGKSMPFTGDPKSYGKYLDRIYKIAKAELGTVDSKVNRAKKINQNLSASAPEASSGGNPTTKRIAPKDISAEDAVKAAMRGISFQR